MTICNFDNKRSCTLCVFTLIAALWLNMPLHAKKIAVSAYPKIGILVCRMGNILPIAPMPKITLKTDYAVRTATSEVNVNIDDEDRLRDFLPGYPAYPASNSSHSAYYYQNLTAPISSGLVAIMKQHGFQAFDLRSTELLPQTPLSEQTVQAILIQCKGKVDALFVLHYMDIGSSFVDKLGVKAANIGFTTFMYGAALFDVSNEKRLFYYSPLLPISLTSTLAFDKQILGNPQDQDRLKITCEENAGSVKIQCELSAADLTDHFCRIIWNGFACPDKAPTPCHQKLNCHPLKGLLSYFE
jgi:hypothetical protein